MKAAEPSPVRVLLVEDDPADRELIERELANSALDCRVDAIDNREALRELLDKTRYDVVLADYNLRGWRGMEVLPELRRRGHGTPLILVTGTVGEERAVECIREGATDCVLKSSLVRLPFVVTRAIEEARSRREHEATLETMRRLSVAVDQSPAAVVITDTTGTIQYVNRRFTEITGYSEAEALGANPRILRSGRTPPQLYEEMWQAILEGRVWRGELLNRRKSGDLYWAQASISPMRDADGVVTHFVAVEEDVTERRWAEEAIQDREERLRQIADNINEVFYVVDADFQETLFMSPAYEEVWGRTVRSAYEDPRSFVEGVHPGDRSALIGYITRIRAGEHAGALEFRVVQPSGEERWVRSHASPVLDEHGTVYRLAGVALDITERKHAEDRLRESEERFRKLTEASFDAILVIVEGVIREVNPGFEELLGFTSEEVVGKPALDLVTEESRSEVERRLTEGVDGTYEAVVVRKDGKHRLCEVTGKTHQIDGRPGRVTALRDLTETRALERQLRQAQKLEAVGRLAGGVAHDFNNVLTVILMEAQLLGLSDEAGDNEDLAESLREIELAGKQAAALTRQLLTFSRRDVIELEIVDPTEVTEGLNKMLGRLIGEDVRLDVAFGESVGNVRIDRGQLEQVIVNLVVNARDAMPTGGEARVEVREVVLDEEYARTHSEVAPGHYVLVAVSDTGVGIPPEVRERLFEPFFTTKPEGKGTGLGLATSYGIVKDIGGHIGIYSEVGVGTTMKVYLPIAEGAPATGRIGPLEATLAPVPLAGSILVVEDDDAVRRNAVRALKLMGYQVLSASNGSGALAVLEEVGGVDVLFTDVVMPGMSGPDLASKAKELSPHLKVLFTTGYTADMALRHRLLDQLDAILPKPYTAEELSLKIRSLTGG